MDAETQPSEQDGAPDSDPDSAPSGGEQNGEAGGKGKVDLSGVREGDGQEYLDRSKLDFDPDEGLYAGSAVNGTSEIPGPHDEEGDEESVIEQARQMTGDESAEGSERAQ